MSTATQELTPREKELGALIHAYSEVTEQLKHAHEQLGAQVKGLREELSRKNRQLRRRERLAALGEMAAGVAHEIRNPLGGIRMFASLLRKDVADRPDAVRLVDKIVKGVAALERVVSDTLDFGRPSDPNPVPIQLGTLLRETAELVVERAHAQNVRVEVRAGASCAEMTTDPHLLQRALLNLLFNAVDAAARKAEGGLVRVECRAAAGNVTISVSDNGNGIPVEWMDRIFNPFFTTKDSGTGLGLSIVHQIAESLGGTVRAANRSGGGAVFSMCLPCEPVECAAAAERMTGG